MVTRILNTSKKLNIIDAHQKRDLFRSAPRHILLQFRQRPKINVLLPSEKIIYFHNIVPGMIHQQSYM